jgi:GMP synthase (glutamine-hydrolysing)
MLRALAPEAWVDVLHPADLETPLPDAPAIARYDGVAWTGSSLTLTRPDDPRVARQLELARAVSAAGVPSFGSCWAVQLAAVAAGGACASNPRGREFGLARKIRLSPAGRSHPMFRGKPEVFDAFASHGDEVTKLPADATLLASNDFSGVQAMAVERPGGSFWAVQYHPEYDLHEVARLCHLRAEGLVRQGTFRDLDAAHAWIEEIETLHRDPSRRDIAWRLGIDTDVLDPEVRCREVRNWIDYVATLARP